MKGLPNDAVETHPSTIIVDRGLLGSRILFLPGRASPTLINLATKPTDRTNTSVPTTPHSAEDVDDDHEGKTDILPHE